MLTKTLLDELASQLPLLNFDKHDFSDWKKIPNATQYLDDYHIHFEQEFKSLKHGFGKIKLESFSIAAHYWVPKNAQATLVVVHGYFDHVGIYQHIIRHALEKNLAVLAFDLPGHGLSSGEPVVIDSFDQYTQVLAQVLTLSCAHLPAPLFAAGQSTGSAVLLNYLWRTENAKQQKLPCVVFEKIFLCSPLVISRGWRGWQLGAVAYEFLRYILTFLKRGPTKSSHDPEFNQFIDNSDPLQSKRISMRWIGAMKEWNNRFKHFAALEYPVQIIQGTEDGTVDWEYNIPLIQSKLPKAQVEYLAGAGHQLVNETPELRAQVFNKMDQYFFKK